MNLSFSDEQEMLRASARGLMTARYPIDRVAMIADGSGFDRGEWDDIAAQGWIGISVPEDEGGAGLGFVEEMILEEELGRALYPGPFLSTVVLALPTLRAAGATDVVPRVAGGGSVATLAWADRSGVWDAASPPPVTWRRGRLWATRLFVPHLTAADLVVVVGEHDGAPAAWAVETGAEGLVRIDTPGTDATRPLGELRLAGSPATFLGAVGPEVLSSVLDRARAALAAEACGVASRALDLAVQHARSRKQFGRAIGSFQAVSHQLAQAYLEVETARSLTYWAGWAVAVGAPEAPAAAAAAKARAAEAAVTTAERAIQALGGIGFTWEHPLHRLYRRALGVAATMGTADELWARVADTVLRPAGRIGAR